MKKQPLYMKKSICILKNRDIGQTSQNRIGNWSPSLFSPNFAQIAIDSSIPIPQLRNLTKNEKNIEIFWKIAEWQFLNWGIATCRLIIGLRVSLRSNQKSKWGVNIRGCNCRMETNWGVEIPQLRNRDSSIAESGFLNYWPRIPQLRNWPSRFLHFTI